jgi:hypothetical protein
MQIVNAKFDQHVANTGDPRYRHVAEGFAKHLEFPHMFSTKLSPADQSGGMIPAGVVFCNDGVFASKPRNAALMAKNGNVSDYPSSGEIIAMSEWPTQARIRGITVVASSATDDPLEANLNYFDADTAAAFPAFTLQANDPNDPDFVPIPLLDTVTTELTDSGTDTVDVTNQRLSLAAIAFGVNRRKNPLIIECVLGGDVVANCLLAVYIDYVIPHT